jgi:hypothetical protein
MTAGIVDQKARLTDAVSSLAAGSVFASGSEPGPQVHVCSFQDAESSLTSSRLTQFFSTDWQQEVLGVETSAEQHWLASEANAQQQTALRHCGSATAAVM